MKRLFPTVLFILVPVFSSAQGGLFTLSLEMVDVWRGRNLVDAPIMRGTIDVAHGRFTAFLTGRLELTNTNSYPPTPDPAGKLTSVRGGAFYTLPLDRKRSFTIGAIAHQYPGVGQAQTMEVYYAIDLGDRSRLKLEVMQDVDEVHGFYVRASVAQSYASGFLKPDGSVQPIELSAHIAYGNNRYNEYYYGAYSSTMTDFGIRVASTFDMWGTAVTPFVVFTTLLDSDLLKTSPDRSNFYAGASVGFRF